jgi:diguanylate cyclase (GGDEF)-like protein/PAS domain S-box-containing protein
MNKIKNLFNIQIIIFTLIIVSLFLYLFKIEVNIRNFNNYKNEINNLKSLNLEFDIFLNKQDKFINFDEIVEKTKSFDNILDKLEKSEIKQDFGSTIIQKLDDVEKSYYKKLDVIERFKSIQATTLNSVHFVYDINEYYETLDINKSAKLYINNIQFLLMQYFLSLNDNKKNIYDNLDYLKKENKKLNDKRLELLEKHTKIVLNSVDKIKNLIEDAKTQKLNEKIEILEVLLHLKYNEKLFFQQIIATIFFFSILIILFIVYIQHKRTLKIKSELSAFKYAVENSDNSIVLTDPNRKILYVNDIFEKNTGYLKDELLGEKPKVLSSGLTAQEVYDDLNEKLDSGKKWEGEFINKRKDGTIFYEKASIVPILLDGEIVNYLAIKLDVTKYIEQNEKLKLSSIVFNNIQEGVLICNEEQKIIAVNKAFELISGYRQSELVGKKPNIFKSGKHDVFFYKQMWQQIHLKGFWKGKIYDKRKDGKVIPIWLNITQVKDKNNEITKYIAVHTNLEEIIKNQEKADFLAYHDSLTSLPNRVKLEEDLNYTLNFVKRNELNLFLLFIDLDRFKIINDTLGHDIGDELLKIISKRIKNLLRETDIVARMGGDEFIVVLDSVRNKKAAGYVCESILSIIKEPIIIGDHTLNVSASIGVVMYPDDGIDITTLVKNADTAMYHAKKLGKNTYQYYDEKLSIAVHEQLQIEQALKEALIKQQMYLNYQPQYLLKTKEIIAFEALVRWEHPDLGLVRPDIFIPIAEDTGMIIEIGKFVFNKACEDFVRLKKANQSLKYIAINISSIQFKNKNFINDITSIVKQHNLNPNEIELEVTERYLMDFTKDNLDILNKIRDLGFRFSIDDFGTGYSSMSYLSKLPIDVIKVDKSFIDGIPHDNNNVQISKAIIALSKSLGFSVTAEGIEEPEHEEFLIKQSCNLGQGFLFSKPLNLEDSISLLKKSN